ncbi:ras-related protein Rab-1C [Exaiptasia diaphana]|uniref:Uncharacterized protein n=1 Tax=Exaiptasia diaphana TaxID=2652724 RepID=A0A913XYU9_EXADI|nr:ras-related protein Rab-1C [Exaiptasia diaphana]
MADQRADGESELESSTSSRKHSGTGPSKVILIGRSGVGKSTLFLRIKDGKFHDNIQGETLDYLDKKIIVLNNKSVDIRLFDTAGMEKWHEKTITRSYYRESRVALIMYSADDMDSVDDLKDYIEDVNRHAPGAKKFLIRNKIDLEDQAVREEEVEAKLNGKGYSFEKNLKHKISAKDGGQEIEDLLKEVGIVLLKQAKSPKETQTISSFRINTPTTTQSDKNACC